MSHLPAGVPQGIEQSAEGRRGHVCLVRQQDQQVDVRMRRELATAVPADRDPGQVAESSFAEGFLEKRRQRAIYVDRALSGNLSPVRKRGCSRLFEARERQCPSLPFGC